MSKQDAPPRGLARLRQQRPQGPVGVAIDQVASTVLPVPEPATEPVAPAPKAGRSSNKTASAPAKRPKEPQRRRTQGPGDETLTEVAGIPLPSKPRETTRPVNLTWYPSFTERFEAFIQELNHRAGGDVWNRSNLSQYLLEHILQRYDEAKKES